MCGHIIRGRFTPRCAECDIDVATAWPPQVRIPVLVLITLAFMRMHPAIANSVKRAIWMLVKPLALLIGWSSVVVVRFLIFLFIDGPKMMAILLTPDNREDIGFMGTDAENNTKLNAIWSRLHNVNDQPAPSGVFDKKYKPFLPSCNMKLAGSRQQKALTRNRGLSC
ncbi:hypothetical protein CH063_15666 [Colletotrichum higginsianum]|uniref:Uncharacterized protein n=2 Tax=Colletotrichum higginsianum TaxID=80884 RepID=H1W3W3_COLHI|nr:hypothetical protein CH63R_05982 [Colletotrichum higginsianum IMI 349063]OBR10290.1 hypothetical protein CH63R_05982 [Colletotrichum higginsianum IMI 349063]TID06763.1 hypothetical protein CH35J_001178 [Colletotrichum higginsianum]GJD02698.1 hypothetical protein ColKHC_11523 [Colletotrichum higginsianum]CCF47176.1 hypothetical protein CH063_15666 [Colletotrichum higginsianum]